MLEAIEEFRTYGRRASEEFKKGRRILSDALAVAKIDKSRGELERMRRAGIKG